MLDSIENLAGQIYRLRDRVRHSDGWTGTITAIKERHNGPYLLIVEPDDISALARRDCWALNAESAAACGRSHFVRPRDHGLTMGNYTVLGSEVVA